MKKFITPPPPARLLKSALFVLLFAAAQTVEAQYSINGPSHLCPRTQSTMYEFSYGSNPLNSSLKVEWKHTGPRGVVLADWHTRTPKAKFELIRPAPGQHLLSVRFKPIFYTAMEYLFNYLGAKFISFPVFEESKYIDVSYPTPGFPGDAVFCRPLQPVQLSIDGIPTNDPDFCDFQGDGTHLYLWEAPQGWSFDLQGDDNYFNNNINQLLTNRTTVTLTPKSDVADGVYPLTIHALGFPWPCSKSSLNMRVGTSSQPGNLIPSWSRNNSLTQPQYCVGDVVVMTTSYPSDYTSSASYSFEWDYNGGYEILNDKIPTARRIKMTSEGTKSIRVRTRNSCGATDWKSLSFTVNSGQAGSCGPFYLGGGAIFTGISPFPENDHPGAQADPVMQQMHYMVQPKLVNGSFMVSLYATRENENSIDTFVSFSHSVGYDYDIIAKNLNTGLTQTSLTTDKQQTLFITDGWSIGQYEVKYKEGNFEKLDTITIQTSCLTGSCFRGVDLQGNVVVYSPLIYPNPMGNFFKLDFINNNSPSLPPPIHIGFDYEIKIYDLMNNLMLTHLDDKMSTTVDMSAVPQGFYILRLTSGQNVFTASIQKL